MTKKHFVGIAKVLNATRPMLPLGQMGMLVGLTPGYVASYSAWAKVTKDMATYLAQQNPAFDRGTFLSACGMTGTGGN